MTKQEIDNIFNNLKEKAKKDKERQDTLKKLLNEPPKQKKARKQIKAPIPVDKVAQVIHDKAPMPLSISGTLSFDQQRFLELFIPLRFNITNICAEVGISRSCYYVWLKENNEFAEAVKNLQEYLIDRSEEVLLNALDANDSRTAQFILSKLSDKFKDKIDITSNGNTLGTIINIIPPQKDNE